MPILILRDISAWGYLHTLLTLIAFAAGVAIFFTRKGGRLHRRLGQVFSITLFVGSAASLFIHKLGPFSFAHAFAVAGMAAIAIGWAAARFHQPRGLWKNIHLSAMIFAMYDILGGGVNEVFLRVGWLREHGDPMWIGLAQMSFMALFVLALLVYNILALALPTRRRRTPLPA
jgi:uncharacterized membrane protein